MKINEWIEKIVTGSLTAILIIIYLPIVIIFVFVGLPAFLKSNVFLIFSGLVFLSIIVLIYLAPWLFIKKDYINESKISIYLQWYIYFSILVVFTANIVFVVFYNSDEPRWWYWKHIIGNPFFIPSLIILALITSFLLTKQPIVFRLLNIIIFGFIVNDVIEVSDFFYRDEIVWYRVGYFEYYYSYYSHFISNHLKNYVWYLWILTPLTIYILTPYIILLLLNSVDKESLISNNEYRYIQDLLNKKRTKNEL